jgi:hypothetical protein
MKKILFLIAIVLISFSCKKSSDTSTDEFSNKLELGTGTSASNSFVLTGVGTTFTAGSLIYFRLESKDDMAGSNVNMKVMRSNGTDFNTFLFVNPQSYGHIMVSSFAITETGNFMVTGILVNGSKTIASVNIVVNAPTGK